MGDFIFYGLLIGKAACNGSIIATFAAILGILIGLILILTLSADYEDSLPALPISLILGSLFHFITLFFIEPLVGDSIFFF